MRTLSILSSLLLAAAAAGALPNTDWQKNNNNNNQCPPVIVSLATGIHLNIVGQVNGELATLLQLQALESTTPLNTTGFLLLKGELISSIQGGIKIREFNQAVAPANNPALPGLAQYAAAQETELGLSEGLTGSDEATLATLVGDVRAGIRLNYWNMGNVSLTCLCFPSSASFVLRCTRVRVVWEPEEFE